MYEKRPRHYAQEILALPLSQRPAALNAVPKMFRKWVAFYVKDFDQRDVARRADGKRVARPARVRGFDSAGPRVRRSRKDSGA